MKNLNNFIQEKLKINSKSKISSNQIHYDYFPKDKEELINIISEIISEEGNNPDLSTIDTSNIKDMSRLFEAQQDLNPNVSNWDVSNVEDMSSMFCNCPNFDGKGLENWDVSNVKNMHGMFYNLGYGHNNIFNPDLSKWNLSKCESIREMFLGCTEFEGKGLENWDLSNLNRFGLLQTFNGCHKFNTDVSNWNINIKLANFMKTFENCYEFEGKGLDKWNVSEVDDFSEMFNGCKKLNIDLNIWEIAVKDFLNKKSKLRILKRCTEDMFKNCETLEKNNLLPDWYKKIWNI